MFFLDLFANQFAKRKPFVIATSQFELFLVAGKCPFGLFADTS